MKSGEIDIVGTDPARVVASLESKAAQVLDAARAQGATAAETGISLNQGFSVSARMRDVETVEFHRDRGISVTVYFGQRKGFASSSDDSPDSIRETVAAACAIARYTSEDSCTGLAPKELLAIDIPDLDLWHPSTLTPDEAIRQALASEAAGLDLDSRMVNSDGASVGAGVGWRVYANSNGFSGGYGSSYHNRSCVLVAGEGDTMQRDYWYDSNRRLDALDTPENIGQRAAQRALARLGGRRPATGDVPVIFAPEVASGLLGHFAGAINGNALYRRASFLRDRLGETLFPKWVNIDERPLWPGMAGSTPFDGDGLPTRNQIFVKNGELVSYALGLYASRRLEMTPTGNGGGVRNLCITVGERDQAQLLRDMKRGILVTEVMGMGVNMVTGDYSRGAAGFWVEDGEIAYPVEEFTIASTLPEIFANLVASGSDVDHRGNVHTGSLWVGSMKVAGS